MKQCSCLLLLLTPAEQEAKPYYLWWQCNVARVASFLSITSMSLCDLPSSEMTMTGHVSGHRRWGRPGWETCPSQRGYDLFGHMTPKLWPGGTLWKMVPCSVWKWGCGYTNEVLFQFLCWSQMLMVSSWRLASVCLRWYLDYPWLNYSTIITHRDSTLLTIHWLSWGSLKALDPLQCIPLAQRKHTTSLSVSDLAVHLSALTIFICFPLIWLTVGNPFQFSLSSCPPLSPSQHIQYHAWAAPSCHNRSLPYQCVLFCSLSTAAKPKLT